VIIGFASEHRRTDASFDDVGVELDAAVVEEPGEPVPVVQGTADVFGGRKSNESQQATDF
jgi:hypothetical protein